MPRPRNLSKRTGVFYTIEGNPGQTVESKYMKHLFSQENAPLFEGLRTYAGRLHAKEVIQFHMPGHRGGKGVDPVFQRLGRDLLALDLTELREINYGEDPDYLLKSAQVLAAEAFGAEKTFFLVNGASIGIAGSLLGLDAPGAEILVARNCHLSVINGLILSGMTPYFISPRWVKGLPALPGQEDLRQAVAACPRAVGIFVTNPGYSGIYGPLAQVAAVAKELNLPLLVDEAHGGHLKYYGVEEASTVGADLWVWGFHKIMGSLTQTGMLHLKSQQIDADRIEAGLQLLGTTSPSYLLLASLDTARRELYLHGAEKFTQAAEFGEKVRQRLQKVKGLFLLESSGFPAGYGLDPTKVVVSYRPAGLLGLKAAEVMGQRFKLQPEYADDNYLYFFISYAQEGEEVEKLIAACTALAGEGGNCGDAAGGSPLGEESFTPPPWETQAPVVTPRQAFFAPANWIRLEEAVGRVAATVVAAYPPGIPLWIPGEKITAPLLEWAVDLMKAGGFLKGVSAGKIRVVADS